MTAALLVLLALLGFANGAIDNSEGIATLVGHGAAKPRQALRWATLTSALGALFSFWFADELVKRFSTGLFASTTHAITGALTGAGLVAMGSAQFQWAVLGAKFALPLAVSPLLAFA